jgi:hypothetical protein
LIKWVLLYQPSAKASLGESLASAYF